MNESKTAAAILAQVRRAVVGKDEVLARVLLAILAGGHILLEDIPGVGKTTMALAFSKALGLDYNRVQFTPDVMPSDITGFTLYNKEAGRMEYQPGAVLCNLFLADELNRATSRTQSALLEAMEEGQVTVDGVSRPIPQPFVVIATQNPTGAAGTQPLPDSQMDRFTLALSLGYPSHQAEAAMVRDRQGGNPLDRVELCVLSRDAVLTINDPSVHFQSSDVALYLLDDNGMVADRIFVGGSSGGNELDQVHSAFGFSLNRKDIDRECWDQENWLLGVTATYTWPDGSQTQWSTAFRAVPEENLP